MVVSHNNMIPSVKLEKRKTFKETVVKCSLRCILLGENVQKDAIVKAYVVLENPSSLRTQ